MSLCDSGHSNVVFALASRLYGTPTEQGAQGVSRNGLGHPSRLQEEF